MFLVMRKSTVQACHWAACVLLFGIFPSVNARVGLLLLLPRFLGMPAPPSPASCDHPLTVYTVYKTYAPSAPGRWKNSLPWYWEAVARGKENPYDQDIYTTSSAQPLFVERGGRPAMVAVSCPPPRSDNTHANATHVRAWEKRSSYWVFSRCSTRALCGQRHGHS